MLTSIHDNAPTASELDRRRVTFGPMPRLDELDEWEEFDEPPVPSMIQVAQRAVPCLPVRRQSVSPAVLSLLDSMGYLPAAYTPEPQVEVILHPLSVTTFTPVKKGSYTPPAWDTVERFWKAFDVKLGVNVEAAALWRFDNSPIPRTEAELCLQPLSSTACCDRTSGVSCARMAKAVSDTVYHLSSELKSHPRLYWEYRSTIRTMPDVCCPVSFVSEVKERLHPIVGQLIEVQAAQEAIASKETAAVQSVIAPVGIAV